MPKVGKVELITGKKRREFDIYYSRTNGFTLKDFPASWVDTVQSIDKDMNNIHYSAGFATEKELVDVSTNIMRRYFEITKVTKRIIIYDTSYGTAIRMNKNGRGSYSGDNPRVGRIGSRMSGGRESVGMDYGVAFDWTVAVLTSGTDDKYFEVELDDEYNEIERASHAQSLSFNKKFIDWTPDRHEFFKAMVSGMESIAKKMNDFFKDKDKMMELMDGTSGKQKLLN